MTEIFSQRSRFWHFNAHAVLHGGKAAVIDPGIFPDEISLFSSQITQRGFVVEHVILTHSHHDHIRGWQHFPHAKITSHRVVQAKDENARKRIVAAKQAIDQKFGVVDPSFSFPPIHQSFDSRISIDLAGTEIEMRYLPGHSDCISVVIVPRAKAMFTGDYLVSPGMPYCRWRIDVFQKALGTLRDWVTECGIESVYPAHNDAIHGQDKILQGIQREQNYFDRLIEAVRPFVDRVLSEDDIAKEVAKQLRPNKLWEQDRDNAKRALRELRKP